MALKLEKYDFLSLRVSYPTPDGGRNKMGIRARAASTVAHVKLLFNDMYTTIYPDQGATANQYTEIRLDGETEPLNDWDIFVDACKGLPKEIKLSFVPNCIQVCVYPRQKPVFYVNVPVTTEETRFKDILEIAREDPFIPDFNTLFRNGAKWYDTGGVSLTAKKYDNKKLCDVNHSTAFHVFEDYFSPLGIETALPKACEEGKAAEVDTLIKNYYSWLDYSPKFCYGKSNYDRLGSYGTPYFSFDEENVYKSLLKCLSACCLSSSPTEIRKNIANKLFALRMDEKVAKQLFPEKYYRFPRDQDDAREDDYASFRPVVKRKKPMAWYEKMYGDDCEIEGTIEKVYAKVHEEGASLDMFIYLLDKFEPFFKFNGRKEYSGLQNFLAPFFEFSRPSPWKFAWDTRNWKLAHAIKKAFRSIDEHETWKMFSMARYKGSEEWYMEGLVNMGSKRRRIEGGGAAYAAFVDLTLLCV